MAAPRGACVVQADKRRGVCAGTPLTLKLTQPITVFVGEIRSLGRFDWYASRQCDRSRNALALANILFRFRLRQFALAPDVPVVLVA
jgi:hypothetical protein